MSLKFSLVKTWNKSKMGPKRRYSNCAYSSRNMMLNNVHSMRERANGPASR